MRTLPGADITPSGAAPSTGMIRRRRPLPPPPPIAPPPASATVTAEMLQFIIDAKDRAEGSHAGAMDDAMQREMVLLTHTLAARADATHVAVQDGAWSGDTFVNATTEEFEVPPAGAKVFIPSGIAVTYDEASETVIDTIRVDGELSFATDQNTKLVCDTIVCDHHSMFRIGTSAAPLSDAYTCEILFPGDADLDPTVDTLLIGRGFVSMGHVGIHGAEKTTWIDASQTRAIGDTTITLDAAPSGWEVGDKITICATEVGTREQRHDDAVTITEISGATITFTPALQYARQLPTDERFSEVRYAVANFTRNILFHSPADTPRHRRGHVMLMHGPVNVSYAAWDWLGRTDKSFRSWDATADDRRIQTMGSDIPWAADSNVRGRYNLHLHKTGTMPGMGFSEVVGCAATESPGWLYAHHAGFANWRENVGRQFFGSGLVSEDGSEIGLWENNLMTTAGVGARRPDAVGEKTLDDVQAGDFARGASAFWTRSRAIIEQGNRAFGCSSGYAKLSRGPGQSPRVANLPEPRAFYGASSATVTTASDRPVIHDFIGNQAGACQTGFIVVKGSPVQRHADRSFFKDVCFWNISDLGWALDYTATYSFLNVKVLGVGGNRVKAMALTGGARDMVFENSVFANASASADVPNSRFVAAHDNGHYFINTDFDNRPLLSFPWPFDPIDLDEYPDTVLIKETDDVGERSALSYEPDGIVTAGKYNDVAAPWQQNTVVLDGIITDALGPRSRIYSQRGDEFIGNWAVISTAQIDSMLSEYGYWTHNGQEYLLIPDIIVSRVTQEDGTLKRAYLTVVANVSNKSGTFQGFVNNGTLDAPYVSGGEIVPVVYEDILA